jgi:hydroxyacylglutathione hydrolase
MAAWSAAGLPEERTELIGPERLGDGPLIDVRQADEVAAGRVPGAVAVELGALGGPGAVDGLPPGRLTLMCARGPRAMTAASVLARAGRPDARVLLGGAVAWEAVTGRPLAG